MCVCVCENRMGKLMKIKERLHCQWSSDVVCCLCLHIHWVLIDFTMYWMRCGECAFFHLNNRVVYATTNQLNFLSANYGFVLVSGSEPHEKLKVTIQTVNIYTRNVRDVEKLITRNQCGSEQLVIVVQHAIIMSCTQAQLYLDVCSSLNKYIAWQPFLVIMRTIMATVIWVNSILSGNNLHLNWRHIILV